MNDTNMGKLGETHPIATLPTTQPTVTRLWLNLGLHGVRGKCWLNQTMTYSIRWWEATRNP